MNPVTFSTLACPEWTTDTVVARAAAWGYDGLEWRGGAQGHVPPTFSPAECRALHQRVAAAGLFSLALTAYTAFTSANPADRAASLAGLRRSVEQAAALEAPFVRVFLGELPPGRPAAAAYPGIIDSLSAAAGMASAAGVVLAIEPHDDFVRAEAVAPVLAALEHPALRVIWDVGNAWAAGEPPADSWAQLGPRLAYLHLKDGSGQGAQWQLTRLGAGEVPLAEALRLMRAGPQPFEGALSVEWERAWHPELPPAEQALPEALGWLRRRLAEAVA